MSTRREREDHQIRAALYDDFQDYIVSSVRGRDNPTLCLKAYDMVKQKTDTHLEVVLENVDNADRRMYEKIEEGFRAGTQMKTQELVANGGGFGFHVYIPLKDKKSGGSSSVGGYFRSGSGSSSRKRRQPSQNLLMLYIIGFCALVIFAVLKTSAVEWRQIPGFPF